MPNKSPRDTWMEFEPDIDASSQSNTAKNDLDTGDTANEPAQKEDSLLQIKRATWRVESIASLILAIVVSRLTNMDFIPTVFLFFLLLFIANMVARKN